MTDTPSPRLQNLPIAWFAMIMGLGGLTVAWHKTETLLALPLAFSPWLLGLTSGLFAALSLLYLVKIVRHRPAVLKEWGHPVKMHFVPSFSIALILLSIAWLPYSAAYSKLLWLVGVCVHLLLTFHVITQWMHQTKFEIVHLNPAWFIPVVGNILVPIAGVAHAPADISWFFFGIGLLFWLPLLTIILYRVIFHGSLPERLMPTLFILIAPPAVAFLSYLRLTGGEVDAFAMVLYHAALFFTLLLFFQLRWFTRLRFFLSWWAYSFPLAAITLATLTLYEQTGGVVYLRMAGILLGIVTVVILGLLIRTGVAVARRDICVEE
ncbi:MAG: SLAC1 anion channel family protein [Thiobacillaceae bacterium]|jgi:tellurite resistance protein|nr:MAG: tellurite resistance/dicarboxylate transporter TDT family [bacterium]KAF0148794.1 MAG: tellurite resistance/dicarboxylate transporter TDT family [bacterium]KAF0167344.1 MAG: tellurite resistance/dicarboxylate transporter TDT family [bacterium]MCU0933979.1 SLAC1 anion channel family protein [Thiobacillaceae bacterium]TXT16329.1 MAG: tellurite resistance/dicarboxylate transporter TDT family [bacterium]